MAPSMMMAPVAFRWNVSGSRMLIAAIGPTPGSTPTAVPITDPISANSRLAGCSAMPKPSIRLDHASMADPACAPLPGSLAELLRDLVLLGLHLGRNVLDLRAGLELDQLAGVHEAL